MSRATKRSSSRCCTQTVRLPLKMWRFRVWRTSPPKGLFRVVKGDYMPQCSKWSTNPKLYCEAQLDVVVSPCPTKVVPDIDGRLHRELEVAARQLVMDGLKCEFSDSFVTRELPPRVRNPKWEDPSLPRASGINGTRRLCVA